METLKELASHFINKRFFDGFVAGQYKEDDGLVYCKAQGCWTNECWVITPDNEFNPVMLNFYSSDKKRISNKKVMEMANDLPVEDYAKIYNGKASPIFNICWDDYLPPCGLFVSGGFSYTWRYYTVLINKT